MQGAFGSATHGSILLGWSLLQPGWELRLEHRLGVEQPVGAGTTAGAATTSSTATISSMMSVANRATGMAIRAAPDQQSQGTWPTVPGTMVIETSKWHGARSWNTPRRTSYLQGTDRRSGRCWTERDPGQWQWSQWSDHDRDHIGESRFEPESSNVENPGIRTTWILLRIRPGPANQSSAIQP